MAKVAVTLNSDEKAACKMLGLREPSLAYDTVNASKLEAMVNEQVKAVCDKAITTVMKNADKVDSLNGEGFTALCLAGITPKVSLFAARRCSSVAKQLFAQANPEYAEVFGKATKEAVSEGETESIEIDLEA